MLLTHNRFWFKHVYKLNSTLKYFWRTPDSKPNGLRRNQDTAFMLAANIKTYFSDFQSLETDIIIECILSIAPRSVFEVYKVSLLAGTLHHLCITFTTTTLTDRYKQ